MYIYIYIYIEREGLYFFFVHLDGTLNAPPPKAQSAHSHQPLSGGGGVNTMTERRTVPLLLALHLRCVYIHFNNSSTYRKDLLFSLSLFWSTLSIITAIRLDR